MRHPRRIEPGPGQESVWDYPRPPRIEPATRLVKIEFGGERIVVSRNALRVLETAGAPTYYIPQRDISIQHLKPSGGRSTWCEWKGSATYFNVVAGDKVAERAVWTYLNPTPRYRQLIGHFAFFPGLVSAFLDDERVTPQPGGFYGGWVTRDIVGPIKGGPGTEGW